MYVCRRLFRDLDVLKEVRIGPVQNKFYHILWTLGIVWTPIQISLKFVPKGLINNIPAFVQIMAWRRPGDKPLSEPMMVSLLTHICVTRPQWVNLYETMEGHSVCASRKQLVRSYSPMVCQQLNLYNWYILFTEGWSSSANILAMHALCLSIANLLSSFYLHRIK